MVIDNLLGADQSTHSTCNVIIVRSTAVFYPLPSTLYPLLPSATFLFPIGLKKEEHRFIASIQCHRLYYRSGIKKD